MASKPLDPHTLRWCARKALSDMRVYRKLAKECARNRRQINEACGDAASLLAYEFTRMAREAKR